MWTRQIGSRCVHSLLVQEAEELQMKLTGVTSERKWLQTPWIVSLWNFLLQDAAGTDVLFEFRKGPDRLMEEKLIEDMCKDETLTSGSLKLDVSGSQKSILRGKKIEEICLCIHYRNSCFSVFLQKRIAAWLG